jgi:O-antigen/teichoic acid export membrane protein
MTVAAERSGLGRLLSFGLVAQVVALGGSVVLARLCTLAVYGNLRIAQLAIGVASSVLTQSVLPAVSRFRAGDSEDRVPYGRVLALHVLPFSLAITGWLAWVAWAHDTPSVVLFGPCVVAIGVVTLLAGAALGRGEYRAAAWMQTVLVCALALAQVAVGLAGHRSVLALGAAAVAGTALAVLVALALGSPGHGGPRLRTTLLRQCWSLTGLTALSVLAWEADRIVVSLLRSSAVFAVYSVGASEVPFVAVVSTALSQSLLPRLTRSFAAGEPFAAGAEWARTCALVSDRLTALAGGAFLLAPAAIPAVFGADYARSAPVFRLYCVLILLRGVNFTPLFLAAHHEATILRGTLVMVGCSVVLVPAGLAAFGLLGAAGGSIAATVGVAAYYTVAARRLVGAGPVHALATTMATIVVRVLGGLLLALAAGRLSGWHGWARTSAELVVYAAAYACTGGIGWKRPSRERRSTA